MRLKTRALIYVYGFYLVVFLVIWVLVSSIFPNLETPLIAAITAAISYVVTPQRRIIKTQFGENVQLKWVFSKKVITIK